MFQSEIAPQFSIAGRKLTLTPPCRSRHHDHAAMVDRMRQGLVHLPRQSVGTEVGNQRVNRGQAAILGLLEGGTKGESMCGVA